MKTQVLEYNKACLVVKVETEVTKKAEKSFGILTTKPKNATAPVWIFSPKRKADVEKLAKETGKAVTVYNPEKGSLAIEAEPYAKTLAEAGGLYVTSLYEGKKQFSGWIFRSREMPVEKLVEICQSLS